MGSIRRSPPSSSTQVRQRQNLDVVPIVLLFRPCSRTSVPQTPPAFFVPGNLGSTHRPCAYARACPPHVPTPPPPPPPPPPPGFLDFTRIIGGDIQRVVEKAAPHAQIWVGETAASWCVHVLLTFAGFAGFGIPGFAAAVNCAGSPPHTHTYAPPPPACPAQHALPPARPHLTPRSPTPIHRPPCPSARPPCCGPRCHRHSGEHGIADAYGSGFWFIDQLGTLASMGHTVMCRQCFVGGNCETPATPLLHYAHVFGPLTPSLWLMLMG